VPRAAPACVPHAHDDRPARASLTHCSGGPKGCRCPLAVRTADRADRRHRAGQARINLSVGEPQHSIPPFVARNSPTHLNEFGAYPANKGIEPFRRASPNARPPLQLARPVDADSEVLVLNGTREGLFLAAIAAQALGCAPRRQFWNYCPPCESPSVLCRFRAGALAADCDRSICRRRGQAPSCPISTAADDALLARTSLLLARRRTRRAPCRAGHISKSSRAARRFGFLGIRRRC